VDIEHRSREEERERTISFIAVRNRKLNLTAEGAVEFHDEKAAKIQYI
jgi:hypothetical protein